MTYVRNLMSTSLITVGPGDSLKTAKAIMENSKIRHLPVVSETKELLGLLSQLDVLHASVSSFANINSETKDQIDSGIAVTEIMVTDFPTVTPDMPLREAASIFLEKRINCLPVVVSATIVGILTETDFLKLSIMLLSD